MARWRAVLAALCLLPAATSAQHALSSAPLQMGLPSASLDRQPLTRSTSDLFRARPTTFAPEFNEPPRFDPRLLCCDGFVAPVFAGPPWGLPVPQVVYVPVIVREAPPPAPVPPPPATAPPPAPPSTPGPPRTFYVIPRCYAGDKVPDREALPPGCDIRRLRTIPPRIP